MAISGSEEFYGSGGQTERPTAQFQGSEEQYRNSIAQGQHYQQQGQAIQEKMGNEQARGIENYYAPIVDTIKNIAPAYYKGRKLSDEAELDRSHVMSEEARQPYAATRAESEAKQGTASVAGTEAGTAATVENTAHAKEMNPLQVQAQQNQNNMAGLNKQAVQAGIRSANLQNDTAETQQKASTIAAIFNSKKTPGMSPQDQLASEQSTLQDLKSRGTYDDTTIAKGQQLAKTEAFQNQVMNQNILNADPSYHAAQDIHQKVGSAVEAVKALKSELANVENDSSLIDDPAFKQGIQNIGTQLRASGQNQLADSLDKNFAESILTGSPATKVGRAKAALASVSHVVTNQIAGYAELGRTNPHINVGRLNDLKNQAYYDPNMPAAAQDIFSKVRGGGNQGSFQPTASQMPAGTSFAPGAIPPASGAGQPAQQPQQQPQQPPVDLRSAPGVRNTMPPAKGGK